MKRNIAYFKAPATANFELETLGSLGSTPLKDEYTALVAVEGIFKDSKDQEHNFTPERLNTIVEHTNRAIESGNDLPVCADHHKDMDNVLGKVNGNAFTKIVTAEDLPNKKSAHLIGKLGLFLGGVKVQAEKGLNALRSGIKSVSMGLNLDPNEHRIMELSLVPIPAIPSMGLFHKKLARAMVARFAGIPSTDTAVTWEELDASNETIDDLQSDYQELCNKLWTLLQNVFSNEDLEIDSPDILLKLIYTQLNGFSLKVIDLLGLTQTMNSLNGVGDPNNPMSKETPDSANQMNSAVSQDMATAGMATGSPERALYKRSHRNKANFACGGAKKRYRRV